MAVAFLFSGAAAPLRFSMNKPPFECPCICPAITGDPNVDGSKVEVVVRLIAARRQLKPDIAFRNCEPAPAGDPNVDASKVEVVVRLIGYNLVPFDNTQQAALQAALVAIVPSISAPVRILRLAFCMVFTCWPSTDTSSAHTVCTAGYIGMWPNVNRSRQHVQLHMPCCPMAPMQLQATPISR